jgi:hypothetical protein
LNVLSKLGNQGLEWRLEPEAFTGREVGREDNLLDFLVGCPVDTNTADIRQMTALSRLKLRPARWSNGSRGTSLRLDVQTSRGR